MNVLIVRLGAFGDIIHALPVAAAIRDALPHAQIDWLVAPAHQPVMDLVVGIDAIYVLPLRAGDAGAWRRLIRTLRGRRYDVALDLQGLIKSAALARLSGARRVIGFAAPHLRERVAAALYTEAHPARDDGHVIEKNLSLVAAIGARRDVVRFPLRVAPSLTMDRVRQGLRPRDDGRFAVINVGGAWPNKRPPSARLGELAARLGDRWRIPSVMVWGPGEEGAAQAAADLSDRWAQAAPPTSVAELAALIVSASLVVSADTGPLHLAAALGRPTVGIYGPTSPVRNGPWGAGDTVVSRFAECHCHYQRRCTAPSWCLADVAVGDLMHAVERRLGIAAS